MIDMLAVFEGVLTLIILFIFVILVAFVVVAFDWFRMTRSIAKALEVSCLRLIVDDKKIVSLSDKTFLKCNAYSMQFLYEIGYRFDIKSTEKVSPLVSLYLKGDS